MRHAALHGRTWAGRIHRLAGANDLTTIFLEAPYGAQRLTLAIAFRAGKTNNLAGGGHQ